MPEKTKILIAKLPAVGPEYPLSREKLSPVLAYFVVNGVEEGFQRSLEMLHMGGLGHSAVIHSTNDDIIKAFGEEMKVGRVIVNSPSSQGASAISTIPTRRRSPWLRLLWPQLHDLQRFHR